MVLINSNSGLVLLSTGLESRTLPVHTNYRNLLVLLMVEYGIGKEEKTDIKISNCPASKTTSQNCRMSGIFVICFIVQMSIQRSVHLSIYCSFHSDVGAPPYSKPMAEWPRNCPSSCSNLPYISRWKTLWTAAKSWRENAPEVVQMMIVPPSLWLCLFSLENLWNS